MMNIKIISKQITLDEVRVLAKETYRDMIKGVADVRREVIALGGDWHMDANAVLLADGSQQNDAWGFNLYLDKHGDEALKFVSLINIRPAQGKRSMELEDKELRHKISAIVRRCVPELFV
ncbi:MAG: hypothetical protein RLZZ416_159 [Candidatus Parcubacteria bacterium]|jgi:hypothetical protein